MTVNPSVSLALDSSPCTGEPLNVCRYDKNAQGCALGVLSYFSISSVMHCVNAAAALLVRV